MKKNIVLTLFSAALLMSQTAFASDFKTVIFNNSPKEGRSIGKMADYIQNAISDYKYKRQSDFSLANGAVKHYKDGDFEYLMSSAFIYITSTSNSENIVEYCNKIIKPVKELYNERVETLETVKKTSKEEEIKQQAHYAIIRNVSKLKDLSIYTLMCDDDAAIKVKTGGPAFQKTTTVFGKKTTISAGWQDYYRNLPPEVRERALKEAVENIEK
ncbi:hypothetical protein Emin_0831 [Elusimicrobium minutum Pei191]|uniref:Uncharacterized protein n=1 Tax=Elusimicrobium minutum (strain Pei191) TaxID=445932 RepID=B2KCZ0_ELUMP|nr:hypothetical protein [Elusimicrobium minutum]ACC98386.1 hypothetical protein Emin_0831 [Elusimicrobium minutum Pei191]